MSEGLPFLNGAYVATAAVPGLFLVVDGPYCVRTKAEMQHAHDLTSDLLRPVGRSRVVLTDTSPDVEEVAGLALDRAAHVERILATVAAWPEADGVLATSFDFHQLTGLPLDRLVARVAASARVPVLHVPSRSLGGGWLDGYAAVCGALASGMDLPGGGGAVEPDPNAVAVVGHMMDRGEADQVANVAEVVRLVNALGAVVACTWLSGAPLTSLREAARASTILSLPYAREAARTLSSRTGARLVETPLPVGLSATADLVRALGAAIGRPSRAEAVVEGETAAAVRDTERHVARLLAGRPVRIDLPDPVLSAALGRLCDDVGAVVEPAFASGGLLLSNGICGDRRAPGYVPVGYPNYLDHPVLPRPTLGFAGFRSLVERMCDAALRVEA